MAKTPNRVPKVVATTTLMTNASTSIVMLPLRKVYFSC